MCFNVVIFKTGHHDDDDYYYSGALCSSFPRLDVDECGETTLPCPGLAELCTNLEGSFVCDCAHGFIRRNDVCVRTQPQSEYSLPCIALR